jgi:hypothetical protein
MKSFPPDRPPSGINTASHNITRYLFSNFGALKFSITDHTFHLSEHITLQESPEFKSTLVRPLTLQFRSESTPELRTSVEFTFEHSHNTISDGGISMNAETEIIIGLTDDDMKSVVGGGGGCIDPNGGSSNCEEGDNGCGIDPNG